MTEFETIRKAWCANQAMRPFVADGEVLRAITPPGGEWICVAPDGAITRSVMWGVTEVCQINPQGQLTDSTEGDIAMGLCATPVMDTALRVIMTLAADAANLSLIAKVAMTAIAYVERPAPELKEPDDDGEAPDDDDGAF